MYDIDFRVTIFCFLLVHIFLYDFSSPSLNLFHTIQSSCLSFHLSHSFSRLFLSLHLSAFTPISHSPFLPISSPTLSLFPTIYLSAFTHLISHSLSLSLSHTHTHTLLPLYFSAFTHLPLFLSLPPPFSLSLSLSLSYTHTLLPFLSLLSPIVCLSLAFLHSPLHIENKQANKCISLLYNMAC